MGLIFGSLFRADFTVMLRSFRTLLLNFLLPIFLLIIFGLHSNKAANGFGNVGFEIGLSLTYGLMSSGLIGYAITVARDRDAGVFQRLRVTPAPPWAIMVSRLLVQIIVVLAMTIVVVAIGSIMHHLAFTPWQLLLIGGVSLLGGAMFLAIGQAIVGLVRSATSVNAVARLFYIVFLILGVIGSSGLLGQTVQVFAEWTPAGAVVSLYSAVLNLSTWGGAQTAGLISSVVYIVVGAFIGIRWFRWDSR